MLLHIKFYDKPVSLIYKLQLLSYQSTSSITPRLPLHASQSTPKMYNALHNSHVPNILKKTSHTRSTTTPKCTLPQHLLLIGNMVHKCLNNLAPLYPSNLFKCRFRLLFTLYWTAFCADTKAIQYSVHTYPICDSPL